jgi:hypothetical protein
MSLLFAERPLVINTQLAMKIGLNEAIVLQQLHYWLRDTNSGMECDGVRWIYNTTEQWLEQFPFWSESTLKRAFASLKTLGLLRCEKLNKSKRDMTNFYTINYGCELLDGGKLSVSIAGQKMKLSTTTAKTGSVSRHQCANSLMPFATTARLFLALSVNVRSTFTKTLWH